MVESRDLPTEDGAVVRALFRGHQHVQSWVRTCDGRWKTSDLGSLTYEDSDLDLIEVLWPTPVEREYRVERRPLRWDGDWEPATLFPVSDREYAEVQRKTYELSYETRVTSRPAPARVWTPIEEEGL